MMDPPTASGAPTPATHALPPPYVPPPGAPPAAVPAKPAHPPPLTAVYGVHRPDSSIFKRGGKKREAPASKAPGGAPGDEAGGGEAPAPEALTVDAADAGLDDAAILKAKLDAMHAAWAARALAKKG